MATHSSTLAWRIPWREEPGRLQSMRLRFKKEEHSFCDTVKYMVVCVLSRV